MKKELTAQIGVDGMLSLLAPLGAENANKTVRVVVETVEETSAHAVKPFASREEWLRFIDETSGKWQGDFERPPQGEYEVRDSL